MYDKVNDDLRVRSERLLRPTRGSPFNPENRDVLSFATAGGYFYIITGPQGNILQASEGTSQIGLPDVTVLEEKTQDGAAYLHAQTADGEDVRVYVQPVESVTGAIYYFQVGRSIEPEQEAMRRLLFILGAGGVAGLALAAAAGFWLAGRALQPIQVAMDAQRTFVADASHELRTPLSLIRANAEILKRQPDGPPEQASVDDIIKEADHLTYLVGQMLTLARADTSDAAIEHDPVPLGRLAEDVARQMRLIADTKDVTIAVMASSGAIVEGDEQRLSELLIILLDNAVKYTDAGGSVTVSVARDGGNVQLKVADTGQGIPSPALTHVFDRFYRADKARSRAQGGTGLGLAIARWIVDAHGGAISIDSEVGRGTTVTAQLPGVSPEEWTETGEPAEAEAPETG